MLDAMEKAVSKASACPFCGSTKLDISSKSKGYICVFCMNCHTYGPRILEYVLPENANEWNSPHHYFKSLKDLRSNSDGHKYRPSFIKNNDLEVPHNWYYEEAVRKWNERKNQTTLIGKQKESMS